MTEMKGDFLDLQKLNHSYQEKMKDIFSDFLDKGWYILGDGVKSFEAAYSEFSGTKYCIGVANGLDAIVLCLKAIGIAPGDEVIVPSNTYIATWLAVNYVGAIPIPVEPRISTYNINPDLIEKAITNRTRAIIPVHLYGQCCEMGEIINIANRYSLNVVEDNAQSQGARYNNQMTGSFGIANATSFYPGKNLGAFGDAGAVTTSDEEIEHKIRVLRNYGSERKYYNEVKGINSRLDELQALFLSIKLKYLEEVNLKRIERAAIYNEALSCLGNIVLPRVADKCTSVYHQYVIRTKSRDNLQKFLADRNIGTMIHYPIPPHKQGAYNDRNFIDIDFHLAEEIANTCLSLPISSELTEEEQNYVIKSIKDFCQ